MTIEVRIDRNAGIWETLFLRSLASECAVESTASEESVIRAGTREARLRHREGVEVRGELEWSGAWDLSPVLVPKGRRSGAWIVLLAAEDLDDRLEALLVESVQGAALRGHTLRVVALGELSRASRAVQHVIGDPTVEELLRLASVARAILRVTSSRPEMARLAARTGCPCVGVGVSGEQSLSAFSSTAFVDALEQAVHAPALAEAFAPELISMMGDRART